MRKGNKGLGKRVIVEAVESRRLLATVSGTVFFDVDNDGVKDSVETGWFKPDGSNNAAVTFYADLNANTLFDSGSEPSTTISNAGNYSIDIGSATVVAIRSTYTIDLAKQKTTAVYAPVKVITIVGGADKTDVNIPCREGAVYYGRFFTDANGNGSKDADEKSRNDASIFFDSNNDGAKQNEEPFVGLLPVAGTSGVTADYTYQIPVPTGDGVLRLVEITASGLSIPPVSFTAVKGVNKSRNFTMTPEMVLTGSLFKDLDKNGKRKQEPNVPLGLIQVWLDFNKDGKWDKDTEPASFVDEQGNYRIVSRNSNGTFGVDVRFRTVDTPADSVTQLSNTFAAGESSATPSVRFAKVQDTQTKNFGFDIPELTLTGTYFNEINNTKRKKDGIRQSDETDVQEGVILGWLDFNGNNVWDGQDVEPSSRSNANGIFTITTHNAAAKVTGVRIVFKTDDDLITTKTPTLVQFTSFQETKAVNFGFIVPEMVVKGRLFSDLNSNGVDNTEPDVSGIRVWLDFDRDKKFDSNEPSSVSNADGEYRITTRKLAAVDGVNVRFRSGLNRVSATNTATTSDFIKFASTNSKMTRNYGFAPPSIKLRVFSDFLKDGAFSSGDAPISGWRVYIDSIDNDILDTGEVSVLTDSNGYATFTGLTSQSYTLRVDRTFFNNSTYEVTTTTVSGSGNDNAVAVTPDPYSVAEPVFGVKIKNRA